GPDPAAEVMLVTPRALAADMAAGRVEPSVAFMQGRMKTSGDQAALRRVLAVTATPEYEAAVLASAERTAWSAGALEGAKGAVDHEVGAGPLEQRADAVVVHHQVVVVHAGGPVRRERTQLRGVDRGVQVQLGDAGTKVVDGPLERPAAADLAHEDEVVGEDDAL